MPYSRRTGHPAGAVGFLLHPIPSVREPGTTEIPFVRTDVTMGTLRVSPGLIGDVRPLTVLRGVDGTCFYS